MAIDDENPTLADTLGAIKEGARRCGIQAERIDEEQSNYPITDRILESIRVAQFVIVDLTDERQTSFSRPGVRLWMRSVANERPYLACLRAAQ